MAGRTDQHLSHPPPPAGPEEAAGEEGSSEDPAVKTVLEVFPGRVRHIKKKP